MTDQPLVSVVLAASLDITYLYTIKKVSQQSSASAAGGMINGQVRVFNTTTGAMTVLENEDIVQDK